MHLLPVVLTARDFPPTELAGMRLDGEIYPLADGWCSVDELEGPAHRATAVRGDRSPRLIAELGTAAWVWGAAAVLPPLREFCVDLAARARVRHTPGIRVRELVLDHADRVQLPGAAVTSPLRTAVELARVRDVLDAADAASITALARLGGFGLAECVELMDRRRNLSDKRRAVERLSELLVSRR